MAHQIVKVESKNADWKVIQILNAAGELVENVSVNRTNKKGEVFPKFDEIAVGASVEGQLWQSPAGKIYLFAPKEQKKQVIDSGPAANNGATAEIKNILQLKIIPMLEAIHKEQVIISERLDKALGATPEDSPFEGVRGF